MAALGMLVSRIEQDRKNHEQAATRGVWKEDKLFELSLNQREQLRTIKVGDRVAIVARTGRIYVQPVTKVDDGKVVVPRGEYRIDNGKSCDPFCGDMLRALATDDHFLVMRNPHR